MPSDTPLATLVSQLRTGTNTDPKFALLLGAGASVTSGIPSGGQLIKKWRTTFAKDSPNPLEEQDWYNTKREYGELFSWHFGTTASRRDYIDELVAAASPSWGYLYLSELLRERVFPVVLTTNFDDLIVEACYTYTRDVRPLVCSHDGQSGFRLYSAQRPRVLKLHGDFLFDDIKNTTEELSKLGESMRDHLKSVSSQYGLIVAGYAGNDASVMNAICHNLEDPNSFPHGIYWCLRDGDKLPDRLRDLGNDGRLFCTEIPGFDELMASAYDAVLPNATPSAIADPTAAAIDRTSHLLRNQQARSSPTTPSESRLSNDLAKLAKWAKKPTQPSLQLPPNLGGWLRYRMGDYTDAISLYLEAIKHQVTVGDLILFFECLRFSWDDSAYSTMKSFLDSTALDPKTPSNWLNFPVLSLIHAGKWEEAESMCQLATSALNHSTAPAGMADTIRLNELQIVVHRGDKLSDAQVREIRGIAARMSADPVTQFGCLVLLGEQDDAMDVVRKNSEKFDVNLLDWPIVKLLSTSLRNELSTLYEGEGHHFGKLGMRFHLPVSLP